jgi:CheY-like chemotaxis protein
MDGSGLGLVLARELARAMGATLSVESEPGQGSCFTLELLACDAAPAAESGPCQAVPERQRVVLYVEDEPLNALLMQELFKSRPAWTLHVAVDGAEGVELAQRLRPDLALIDMNLPDISGTEVLHRLRADERTRAMPCIALSADAMHEQVSAALAAGFDDYWTKPMDLTRLLAAVAAALGDPAA